MRFRAVIENVDDGTDRVVEFDSKYDAVAALVSQLEREECKPGERVKMKHLSDRDVPDFAVIDRIA